jgi:hypothetical protein
MHHMPVRSSQCIDIFPSFCNSEFEDADGGDEAGAGVLLDMSIDTLEGIGGSVELDDVVAAPGVANDAAVASLRARFSTNRSALAKRFLSINTLAMPVSTPSERQLVDSLIAEHGALSSDSRAVAPHILRDYTIEMLRRRDDPASQLRPKVRSHTPCFIRVASALNPEPALLAQSISMINQYILLIKQSLARNAALAPTAKRAREHERLSAELGAASTDAPIEACPPVAAPPPLDDVLLPPPATAPRPAARAPPPKRRREGHRTNAEGKLCQTCHQHLGADTGHKRPRKSHGGPWWCPQLGVTHQDWSDAYWAARNEANGAVKG